MDKAQSRFITCARKIKVVKEILFFVRCWNVIKKKTSEQRIKHLKKSETFARSLH